MRLPKTILAAAAMFAIAAPVVAEPVAVLVAIPIPAQLPEAKLRQLFEQSEPQFRVLPGLIRKYYTIGDDHRAGGIYLWRSRAAAEAWYTDAWKAGVLKQWGQPASVTYFAVPVVLEGTNVAAGAE